MWLIFNCFLLLSGAAPFIRHVRVQKYWQNWLLNWLLEKQNCSVSEGSRPQFSGLCHLTPAMGLCSWTPLGTTVPDPLTNPVQILDLPMDLQVEEKSFESRSGITILNLFSKVFVSTPLPAPHCVFCGTLNTALVKILVATSFRLMLGSKVSHVGPRRNGMV